MTVQIQKSLVRAHRLFREQHQVGTMLVSEIKDFLAQRQHFQVPKEDVHRPVDLIH
jgi:hypothetical protein